MKKSRPYFIGGLVFLLLFLTVLIWREIFEGPVFVVSFFDVGQGDAIFIETPQDHQILIDGGPDDKILEKLGNSMPPWDRTIDLVILSHPAADHVTGLLGVLERYQVKHVLWTGIVKDTNVFRAWEKALEREQTEGAAVSFAKAGDKIAWEGGQCPQGFLILHPFESIVGTRVTDDNDTSIVARLDVCTASVLFTGDATSKVEKALVEKGSLIDADILKVGHHGSKTSSSEPFIQAVSPEIAVIQVGLGNRFGHPHEETLETLKRYGIEIRRTDQEGDIVFRFR